MSSDLKYVFWVHSGITFNLAIAYIDAKKIKNSDVIFIYHRIQIRRTPFYSVNAEDFFPFITPKPLFFRFWKNWVFVDQFRKGIHAILKNHKFHLFLPHSKFPSYRLLSNQKNCIGVSYLEEGTMSYYLPHDDKKFNLPLFLNFKGLVSRTYHYEANACEFIALSNEAFNWVDTTKVTILDPNHVFSTIDYNDAFDNTVIICLDGLVYAGLMSYDIYFTAFTRLLKKIKEEHYIKNVTRIYVKLHPATQNVKIHKTFLNQLMMGSFNINEYDFLDESFDVECIIASSNNIKVFASCSSLSIYAELLKKPVYEWSSLFNDLTTFFSKPSKAIQFLLDKSLVVK